MTMGAGEPNVGMFIDEHKKRADSDPNAPPFDDLRKFRESMITFVEIKLQNS